MQLWDDVPVHSLQRTVVQNEGPFAMQPRVRAVRTAAVVWRRRPYRAKTRTTETLLTMARALRDRVRYGTSSTWVQGLTT